MLKRWIMNKINNKIINMQIDEVYDEIQEKARYIEEIMHLPGTEEVDEGVRTLTLANMGLDLLIAQCITNKEEEGTCDESSRI